MKKFTLFIAALMLSAMSFGTTKVSTLTFAEKCNGTGTASDGAVWSITSDAAESTFSSSDGVHYGTGTKPVKYICLNTNSIEGTVSKVEVTCRNANTSVSASVSVTVGNAVFADAQTAANSTTKLTFEGSAVASAANNILITISRASAENYALYCKSVVVTYEQEESFVAKPVITAKE